MIKIAVCDDEPAMARELSNRLSDYFEEKDLSDFCVECFSSGEALGKALLEGGCDFDLIFLDIQMQKPDGMETARLLRRRGNRSLLIFVTVLRECVFGAFEVEAFDYLLKPLNGARFVRTMDRALHTLTQAASNSILIRHGASCTVIPLDQLLFCEVQGRDLYLHRIGNDILQCRERMETFARRLDERFFRCHRSYLVNLDHVRGIHAGQVTLSADGEIPVSRLREREMMQALLRRMRERGQ